MKTTKRGTATVALLAALCLLFGTMGAFASNGGFTAVDPSNVNDETGIATITGLLKTAEDEVALMVFVPGTDVSAVLKAPSTLSEKLYYTATVKSDKDGEFSFRFDMTKGPGGVKGATGVYPFAVACGEVKTGTLSYTNRDELLGAIKTIADCTTAAEVQTALTAAVAGVLGIRTDLAQDAKTLTGDLVEKAYGAVATATIDITTIKSAKVIQTAFEEAAALAVLQSATEAATLQSYAEKYNSLCGFNMGEDSTYAKITSADHRAIVYQAMVSEGDLTSKTAAQKSFDRAALVGYINDITATGTLQSVLKNNAAVLEDGLKVAMNFTGYDALSTDTARANVMNDLAAMTLTSAEAVVTQFNSLVAKYAGTGGSSGITTKPSTGNTGHGGGGGGGGAWTGLPTTTPTTTPGADNTTQKTTFTDLAGNEWAKEAIEALYDRGIVNGKSKETFDPNGNITRAEFIKMIVNAFGLAANGGGQLFTDVSRDDWYYEVVTIGATCKIVNGFDGAFEPNASITREDMAVILVRAAEYVDQTLATGETKTFTDAAAISNYAAEAVAKMQAAGIINGMEDGSFCPQAYATRAQACKMLYELIQ